MANLNIGEVEATVEDGKRLVNAIEDSGVDILHLCGGNARCTTCRVSFSAGEPAAMTEAERNKLEEKGLLGTHRLSCQILAEGDMTIEPALRLSTSDFDSPGDRPADEITPEPVWSS